MSNDIQFLRDEIVDAGRRLYNRGFVASNDGNLSVRVDDTQILITPTGVSKGFMKPEELVLIDMLGNHSKENHEPSSEYLLHLEVYRKRPDIMSVCHAHPPFATGFAVAGYELNQSILPEVIITLGKIPLVGYAHPGSPDLSAKIRPFIAGHDAFLLQNHGALTIGKNVFSAYHKMETLEHFAHILFIAKSLGKVKKLEPDEVNYLIDLRDRFDP